MRVVLRIGGSVVASPVNTELMSKYADVVRKLKERNHEVAVVIGGGSLAREFISVAKNLGLRTKSRFLFHGFLPSFSLRNSARWVAGRCP